MIRPANSPVQADPDSRRAMYTISPTATVMAITEGTRMALGVVPNTATHGCITT